VINIIPIISLSVIPNAVVLVYLSKFFGGEKNRFVLIGNASITLLYFSLIMVLGQTYQLVGIAFAHLTSYTTYAVFLVIADKFNTKVP